MSVSLTGSDKSARLIVIYASVLTINGSLDFDLGLDFEWLNENEQLAHITSSLAVISIGLSILHENVF